MEGPRGMAYRRMLLQIGNSLSEREFNSLKYMCRDFIPRGRMEEIEEPMQLWDALEERERLSPNNLDFLRTLLEATSEGRTDLLYMLDPYRTVNSCNLDVHGNRLDDDTRRVHQHFTQRSGAPQGHPELKREVEFIVRNIGRDWRQLMRALGLNEADIDCVCDSYPRDLKEKVRQSLLLWQKGGIPSDLKHQLLGALRECQRNDMAYALLNDQY